MAGRGPPPKPSAIRARTNKSPGQSTLPSAEDSADNEVPPLPKKSGGWHPMVGEWWESAWRSPMAREWLKSDKLGGLFHVAMLHNDFWNAETPRERALLSSEIRLQEVRFGLSPIDRSRLRWEVEKGEQAAERTAGRRERTAPKKPASDPRSVLKAVS